MWSQGALLLALILPVFSQVLKDEDYRLPLDVYPISYNLTLNPDIDSLTFIGNLAFTFRALKTFETLILNSKNLLIDPVHSFIADEAGNSIEISELLENKDLERILIKPSGYFVNGTSYIIFLNYQGNITEDGTGLYISSYIENGKKEWLLVTQMRPTFARQVFPCLDEPSFRSRFKLSIWHTPDYRAVSNMPPVGTKIIGQRALTEFEETPFIPAYLTGILISKFGSVRGELGFVSLAMPEEVLAMAYSAEIGPKLAIQLEKQLRIYFPQEKIHLVALPDLVPYAMENWGLFYFRKEEILYFPKDSPTVQKETIARSCAHEISHAWIDNFVTIAWWDQLWISEMFAIYFEYYITYLEEPEWRVFEQMGVDLTFTGLALDSPQAEPLANRVLTPQQVSTKFSGLIYFKAPALLRMVHHAMTNPNLFRRLRNYLPHYPPEGLENSGHIWEILHETTFPDELETLMDAWTEVPGFPVVTVYQEGGSVVLSQEPFSIDGNKGLNSSWWIPISTMTSEDLYPNTTAKYWIPPNQVIKIPLSGKWFIINVEGTGFFRTHYHPELLSLISKQLESDHSKIPPLSRASLIDNAVWLSRAGLLDIQEALGLISYLSSESDFIVWKSAAVSLDVLDSLLLHSKIYPLFKSYISSLVNKIYRIRGLSESQKERHVDKVQRQIIADLACRMGDEYCVRISLRHLKALIAGSNPEISPDVRASIYCTAVANGGEPVWEYVLSLYLNNTKDSARYLAALSCSSDSETIKSFLIDSIPELTAKQWGQRAEAFARRKENSDIMLNIIYQNIDCLINNYGTRPVSSVLLTLTKYLTTKKQISVLQEIERLGIGGLEISQIESRRAWLEKNIPLILNFFNSNLKFGFITS